MTNGFLWQFVKFRMWSMLVSMNFIFILKVRIVQKKGVFVLKLFEIIVADVKVQIIST